MSDLSLAPQTLERSRSQLPVAAYFDPELYHREARLIFERRPRYLGHELAVPEVGDHQITCGTQSYEPHRGKPCGGASVDR